MRLIVKQLAYNQQIRSTISDTPCIKRTAYKCPLYNSRPSSIAGSPTNVLRLLIQLIQYDNIQDIV